MPRSRFNFRLCVVFLCAIAIPAAGQAAGGAPDAPDAPDALAALKALLEKPGLSLSTAADSPTDHFGIACRIQGKDRAWELWAVRDGKRVLTLVRSGRGDGKMYTRAVACDGVVVCLDPKQPGGLVLADGAWPSVQVLSVDGEFKFNFGASSKEPSLVFDPGSIIRDALAKAREVKVSADGRAIIARTERGKLAVTPTPAGSTVPCPIMQLEIPGPDMLFVAAVFDRRSAEKIAGLRPLTPDVIKGLGLPTQSPGPAELVRLLSPGGDDPAIDRLNLAASNKLSGLPRDPDYHFPSEANDSEPKR